MASKHGDGYEIWRCLSYMETEIRGWKCRSEGGIKFNYGLEKRRRPTGFLLLLIEATRPLAARSTNRYITRMNLSAQSQPCSFDSSPPQATYMTDSNLPSKI